VHPPAYDGAVPGASDVAEEIWIYNFGPNKLMQRIRFRNGIAANMGSVGYDTELITEWQALPQQTGNDSS